ncbi:MAG: hypothetical protein VXW72_06750 [Candidatus Thermoplasmatota archaeon]|jgi:hypothetical protein|nr:hypothetical protein [Candidatus Thermoplasmatota archaeon]
MTNLVGSVPLKSQVADVAESVHSFISTHVAESTEEESQDMTLKFTTPFVPSYKETTCTPVKECADTLVLYMIFTFPEHEDGRQYVNESPSTVYSNPLSSQLLSSADTIRVGTVAPPEGRQESLVLVAASSK